MTRVEYSSNNSGGSWWLTDADWKALEDAGWTVVWGGQDFCHSKFGAFLSRENRAPNTCAEEECKGHRRYQSYAEAIASGDDGRWLGALAKEASKDFPSLADAIREWEQLTGKEASDNGCSCCGPPHSFSTTDEAGEWQYASGDEIVGCLYPRVAGKSMREIAEEDAK